MDQRGRSLYCNFEDTRLYGMTPEDFPSLLAAMDETKTSTSTVYLDEVQEVPGWERLVRALLDRGWHVCVTGSNASLLASDVGSKLTGRHLSMEVFPFDYAEYLAFTGQMLGAASLQAYLDDGGFPSWLCDHNAQTLRELLRDIIQRDIAARQGLRETRHLMNLCLFLLANTGQPFSMQTLTKSLAIPSVSQTSRYLEALQDAYLILPLPKFSTSFKKRVVAPAKYYAIDNGLRRANAPQSAPDTGRRLENLVYLALRSRDGGAENFCYAGEKDAWECDFIVPDAAIQVCSVLTPENMGRELRGLDAAACLPTKGVTPRRLLILTTDQKETLRTPGQRTVEVIPVWEWLE
ncbi:ATP-binding protein [Opitutaceae bacterium TAV4]|nr:ATP-binding protein [Opitutaceae bacterium TAV4]RRK01681.1 ATP-binding protein [Opitutaceae bacterium TAV3]